MEVLTTSGAVEQHFNEHVPLLLVGGKANKRDVSEDAGVADVSVCLVFLYFIR